MELCSITIMPREFVVLCRMVASKSSVNETYEPNEDQQKILDLMVEGRVNPRYLRENLEDMSKQNIEYHLQQLRSAGWIKRLTRGLYELQYYPDSDSSTDVESTET